MDTAIRDIFVNTMDHNLMNVILSNSTDKSRADKIKIRPVLIKEELLFQASEYIGQKVYHRNYLKEQLLEKLPEWFEGLFKQAEINTAYGKATVLISKKGKATILSKILKPKENLKQPSCSADGSASGRLNLQHNKKKNYILEEGTALPFLIDLGVMTQEGMIVKAKSDKFKQINRFLEFIEDVLPYLNQDRELTILDFGCGKSYLTFALYYYLKIQKGYQINVIGLDLKSDVIRDCNILSQKYGYEKLVFLEGDIASYQSSKRVDMVVTLHACDTATDYALWKAVSWGAQVILSVPCCQHELNTQIKNKVLKPVFQYGIVKERIAALVTDALRAELLETKGYKAQLLEFIEMEHTPKNILIRAVKRNSDFKVDTEKVKELNSCMDFLQVNPCLLRLFQEEQVAE